MVWKHTSLCLSQSWGPLESPGQPSSAVRPPVCCWPLGAYRRGKEFRKVGTIGFVSFVKVWGALLSPKGSTWNCQVLPCQRKLRYFWSVLQIGIVRYISFRSSFSSQSPGQMSPFTVRIDAWGLIWNWEPMDRLWPAPSCAQTTGVDRLPGGEPHLWQYVDRGLSQPCLLPYTAGGLLGKNWVLNCRSRREGAWLCDALPFPGDFHGLS